MAEENRKVLLKTRGIRKSFNGISVLRNVDLSINVGEVHALMGENGAGKSTIIKIITGVYEKDEGEIYIDGKMVEIKNRHDAAANGIAVIYQELSLVPSLTVAENIFLGHEITKGKVLSTKQMNKAVQALIEKYGFSLNAKTRVEQLSMANRQIVEILKALSQDARLVIMDEPTSSLSTDESEKLFETIEELKKKGVAILYISHRLDEVYRISDRLTVMRNGRVVGVLEKGEINPKTVTTMMIGKEIKNDFVRRAEHIDRNVCLEVKNLSYKNLLKDISFKAYGGEVLGIGGLVGSGRTELVKCIYGALKESSGTITFNGAPVSKKVKKNILNGFGFVPEDRLGEGYVGALPVANNIAISSYDKLSKFGVINTGRENKFADDTIANYDIRPADRTVPIGNLSGGNQQKVILGRWMSRELNVLILDEPTVGVDVGVKQELYKYIWKLADSGKIVLLVSSDLSELTYVSDRILVIHDGRFFEEFSHEKATQTAILMASSGVHTEEGVSL